MLSNEEIYQIANFIEYHGKNIIDDKLKSFLSALEKDDILAIHNQRKSIGAKVVESKEDPVTVKFKEDSVIINLKKLAEDNHSLLVKLLNSINIDKEKIKETYGIFVFNRIKKSNTNGLNIIQNAVKDNDVNSLIQGIDRLVFTTDVKQKVAKIFKGVKWNSGIEQIIKYIDAKHLALESIYEIFSYYTGERQDKNKIELNLWDWAKNNNNRKELINRNFPLCLAYVAYVYPNIEKLIISRPIAFKILPKEIGFFNEVKDLEVSHVGLMKGSGSIEGDGLNNIKKLEKLDLSGNQLTQIQSVYPLKNLTELNLSKNPIEAFAKRSKDLIKLKRLNLSSSGFKRIDETLTGRRKANILTIKSLEYLDLSSTAVGYILGEFETENLKGIDLLSTKIKDLPIELFKIKSLNDVKVDDDLNIKDETIYGIAELGKSSSIFPNDSLSNKKLQNALKINSLVQNIKKMSLADNDEINNILAKFNIIIIKTPNFSSFQANDPDILIPEEDVLPTEEQEIISPIKTPTFNETFRGDDDDDDEIIDDDTLINNSIKFIELIANNIHKKQFLMNLDSSKLKEISLYKKILISQNGDKKDDKTAKKKKTKKDDKTTKKKRKKDNDDNKITKKKKEITKEIKRDYRNIRFDVLLKLLKLAGLDNPEILKKDEELYNYVLKTSNEYIDKISELEYGMGTTVNPYIKISNYIYWYSELQKKVLEELIEVDEFRFIKMFEGFLPKFLYHKDLLSVLFNNYLKIDPRTIKIDKETNINLFNPFNPKGLNASLLNVDQDDIEDIRGREKYLINNALRLYFIILAQYSKGNPIERLTIKNATFKKTPRTIGLLKSLKVLEISDSKLFEISRDSLSKMDSIQTVLFNNTEFIEIPAEIRKMPKLVTLSMENNKITEIKTVFYELANTLQYLDLRGNKIKELPIGIAQLKQLTKLGLDSTVKITDEVYKELAKNLSVDKDLFIGESGIEFNKKYNSLKKK